MQRIVSSSCKRPSDNHRTSPNVPILLTRRKAICYIINTRNYWKGKIMNNISDLSSKLKEARQKKNLSQNEVAEKLNISRQAVSRWETGKGSPDINTLPLLSKLYDISIDELLVHEVSISEKHSQDLKEGMSNLDETSPKTAETNNKLTNPNHIPPHSGNTFNREYAILMLLLIFSSFITFIGLIVSLYIFIWTWRNRRHYNLILILAVICILIGFNNLYASITFFLVSDTVTL